MILLWIALSFFVGWLGADRRVGFWGAFLLSIFLSPLIGFIVTIISKTNEQERRERLLMEQQQAQTAALQSMAAPPPASVAQELQDLKRLLDSGAITQAQYEAAVAKVTGVA